MRTTVNLDDDVTAAVEQLRRARGLGLSEAVNELARSGLAATTSGSWPQHPVRLETRSMHLRVDVSNVAEALDVAEQSPTR